MKKVYRDVYILSLIWSLGLWFIYKENYIASVSISIIVTAAWLIKLIASGFENPCRDNLFKTLCLYGAATSISISTFVYGYFFKNVDINTVNDPNIDFCILSFALYALLVLLGLINIFPIQDYIRFKEGVHI